MIGAFALSNNLFIIALGLGIGAMFVRSMTVMLVDKGTLAEYRYLEHGAFWAILALAAIMLASARFHIPEVVTGLIGAVLMGFGGVTAMGCTVGQGLSGVSTLAIGSFIALASIIAGAAATLKHITWRAEQEA